METILDGEASSIDPRSSDIITPEFPARSQ